MTSHGTLSSVMVVPIESAAPEASSLRTATHLPMPGGTICGLAWRGRHALAHEECEILRTDHATANIPILIVTAERRPNQRAALRTTRGCRPRGRSPDRASPNRVDDYG